MEERTAAVLLSAYNGEKNIDAQLESLLQQDCPAKIRILVRDDGSTDGTAALVRAYAAEHDGIELLTGGNIGAVGSFFALLAEAVGRGFDYYAFCDQDDYWLADKLSAALTALEREDDAQPLLYGGCSYLADEQLRKTGGTTQAKKREIAFFNTAIQNICPGHNQVLNHALAQRIVQQTKTLDGIYSWDLWVTNAAAVTGKIVFDPEPHTLYRQHGGNQLPYGAGKLSWIVSRLRRLHGSEGRKFSSQLAAFAAAFDPMLSAEQKREVNRYFSAQYGFFSRAGYACTTKLYRQKPRETAMFRLLYALGAYRPEGAPGSNKS